MSIFTFSLLSICPLYSPLNLPALGSVPIGKSPDICLYLPSPSPGRIDSDLSTLHRHSSPYSITSDFSLSDSSLTEGSKLLWIFTAFLSSCRSCSCLLFASNGLQTALFFKQSLGDKCNRRSSRKKLFNMPIQFICVCSFSCAVPFSLKYPACGEIGLWSFVVFANFFARRRQLCVLHGKRYL